MVFGFLSLRFKQQMAFTFEPEIFFYGLLPIIIFNAGYGLKKRVMPILLLLMSAAP